MTNSFSLNAFKPHSTLHFFACQGNLRQALLGMGLGLCLMYVGSHANLVYAQGPAKTRAADFIVAVVNSEPITNNEVQSLKLRLLNQLHLREELLAIQLHHSVGQYGESLLLLIPFVSQFHLMLHPLNYCHLF